MALSLSGRERPERWALPTTAPFGVRTFLRGTTFRTGNRLEARPKRPGDHRARHESICFHDRGSPPYTQDEFRPKRFGLFAAMFFLLSR